VEELGRARPKHVSKLFLVLSCSMFLSFSHIHEERLKTLELANNHLKQNKKTRELQRRSVAATLAAAP
jgi:hypothetical protein